MNPDNTEVPEVPFHIFSRLPMQLFGRSRVSEFLGDRMVYRGLNACDPRLPDLRELQAQAGLPAGFAPRKHEKEYARIVSRLLHLARQLDAPGTDLKRLLFVGDTRMSDVGAFQNLCQVGGWPGIVFICSEDNKPAAFEATRLSDDPECPQELCLANRWGLIAELDEHARQPNFPIDESTVVVVDLDKTALGGRGRNSEVIDQARLQAVRLTVANLLESAFDPDTFQAHYNRLNKPEFHPFTADNQDYLAYTCLVLGAGFESINQLINRIQSGELATFEQFIQLVEGQKRNLPSALEDIHNDIYACTQAGDPTPFKEFRRNEYRLTASRMGSLPDEADIATILSEEIVITQEVLTQAVEWQRQGALLFGLSDKPDEASLPPAGLASQGWQPLHRTVTHVVGQLKDSSASSAAPDKENPKESTLTQ
jgi:hypothetical protein